MSDVEALARAWVDLQQNWWAHDVLDDASEDDPELAWSAIRRVIEDSPPSQELLEVTAAGPLESLLRAHGAMFVDRVEAAAHSHEAWRKALSIARLPSAPDPVTQRLFALGCARMISIMGLPSNFIGDVREYVRVIESSDALPVLNLLARFAELLARIYAASLTIVTTLPTDDTVPMRRPSPLKRLATQLGPLDPYFCVFDARVDGPPIIGSLADDLADIYLDLAVALDEFDAGRHDDAVCGGGDPPFADMLATISSVLFQPSTRFYATSRSGEAAQLRLAADEALAA